MNRTEKLNSSKEKLLIPYICVGDGGIDVTEKIIYTLEKAGVSAIELGIPFSDPLADNSVMLLANLRAFGEGFKIKKYFELVKNIRKKSQMPLICRAYFSSIIGYGTERFVTDCIDSGIDSLVIPDLPYEEYDELTKYIDNSSLSLIPIISTTSQDRIEMLVKNADGFIYCDECKEKKQLEEIVAKIKKHTCLPVCVETNTAIDEINRIADGCIIKSALIGRIFDSGYSCDEINEFIRELK